MRDRMGRSGEFFLGAVLLAFGTAAPLQAGLLSKSDGWPTYRHDGNRSGITSERVSPPLVLRWTFHPTHAPQPAWPMPAEELLRSHFDSAYHTVMGEGLVFFASSVDNKITALDARTGTVAWTFFTEGPVRCAPSLSQKLLYAGSDDGQVYCLQASSGRLMWRFRAGPRDAKVIGNGRMISLWPVRTDVLIKDGIAYVAAGVFPYEGIFVYALNSKTGDVIWKSDTAGDQAHTLNFGGVSPQSYLVASEANLYVPSGRAMPAVFDRKTGTFLFALPATNKAGGNWTLLQDGEVIAGVDRYGSPSKFFFDDQSGKLKGEAFALYPGKDLLVTRDTSFSVMEQGIESIDRARHADAVVKLNALGEEEKKLAERVTDLGKKMSEATDKSQLSAQIDQASKRMKEISEEKKTLRSSPGNWLYPRKNLGVAILARNVLFAGGDNILVAVSADTGEELWSFEIPGKVLGLAASLGRLVVSTDQGTLLCFQAEGLFKHPSQEVTTPLLSSPYGSDETTRVCEAKARDIVESTGVRKGYALMLDADQGQLALELAKITDLKIVGIESDAKKVAIAKQKLDQAGLYGVRVVVEAWDIKTLPDSFANVIVSERDVSDLSAEEILRVLRPSGGVLCLGGPGRQEDASKLKALADSLQQAGVAGLSLPRQEGSWLTLEAGTPEGSGTWTHLYANPQNTSCSEDRLANTPLGVLWFGDPGPQGIVDRHARPAGPLSIQGRLFIQGEETLQAYDAFNGTFLWKKEVPGAVRVRVDVDGGNLAASETSLFVAAGDQCLSISQETGEVEKSFKVPASPAGARRWGYVAFEKGLLFGSSSPPLPREYGSLYQALVKEGQWVKKEDLPSDLQPFYDDDVEDIVATCEDPLSQETQEALQREGAHWRHMTSWPSWGSQGSPSGARTERMMVSDSVFAFHPDTGEQAWSYAGSHIPHIAIAIGDGKMFFTEDPVSSEERTRAIQERKEWIQTGSYVAGSEDKIPDAERDVRRVVVLEASQGKKLWERSVDLTGCGGDKVGIAYREGLLLFFGHFSNHDERAFNEGSLQWRRITALSAQDGSLVWSKPLNYRRRPVVMGDTIFIEPRACDLRTGEIQERSHPMTGEPVPWEFLRPGHSCGVNTASAGTLYYRSYCAAFCDKAGDSGLALFGGIRPGCWLNLIPANGLLLFPDFSSGCTCSFPIRCSVALKQRPVSRDLSDPGRSGSAKAASAREIPLDQARPWTVFLTHGPLTPVQRWGVNFGAPGDRKDDQGMVWFGYPRPGTWYGVKFDLKEEPTKELTSFCSDFRDVTIENTDKPWLFTSGIFGLTRLELPLLDPGWGDAPSTYEVRMGFLAPGSEQSGQRLFDVMIQGKGALQDFDVAREAGGAGKALVKTFKNVEVKDRLLIEMVPKASLSGQPATTLINFIEVKLETGNRDAIPMDPGLKALHESFREATDDQDRVRAVEGMIALKDPRSVSLVGEKFRDPSAIVWEYKKPSIELQDALARLCMAAASETKEASLAKGYLKNAVAWAGKEATYQEALKSIEALGVSRKEVEGTNELFGNKGKEGK